MASVGICGAVQELDTCSASHGTVHNPQVPINSWGLDFLLNYLLLLCILILLKRKNREGLISHKHLSELPHISYISHPLEYPWLQTMYLPCKYLMALSSYFWGFCQLLISPVMLKPIQMTCMLVNKESLTIFITFSCCLLYYTSGTGSLRCVM